jgi:hypothetical protein
MQKWHVNINLEMLTNRPQQLGVKTKMLPNVNVSKLKVLEMP